MWRSRGRFEAFARGAAASGDPIDGSSEHVRSAWYLGNRGGAAVFTIMKRTVRNHVACALIGAAVVGCSAESGGSREAASEDPSGQAASGTVRNGGFEQGDGGEPVGWFRDQAATGRKGSVRVDRETAHAGDASLRLNPNERNDEA